MGKRKKAPGSNGVIALPMVGTQRQQQLHKAPMVADAVTSSTPGREVGSSFLQQLLGKLDAHRVVGNNSASTITHLPTITRGPEALRQQIRHHHGSSPLQRTPGSQATMSKVEYLSRIATWAATNKIATLGAFYGERLASACQAAGIPSPVLNSQCGRCESVLLPEVNCSVRVAPNIKKKTWREGTVGEAISSANTVVYRCLYCKYGNRKPGTLKQAVKTKLTEAAAGGLVKGLARKSSLPFATADPATSAHAQPLLKASNDGALSVLVTPPGSQPGVLFPANAVQLDHSASSANKKRKRKGWTGLKAICTSFQDRVLSTPERLRFPVDFTSPLNPRKNGSF